MGVTTLEFRRDDIRRFRGFIKDRWGISISQEKDYLVEAKLRKALDLTGLAGTDELLATQNPDKIQQIAQAVTTNHTFFFREADHFDTLVDDAKHKGSKKLLIWSAAASSGEECYSLAIRLLEEGWRDFLILASDIDHQMLETINQGVYPEFRLQAVSGALKHRYFEAQGLRKGTSYFKVRPELRERVVIKALNLLEPHRFPQTFDYLLCRNVLIYFDHATQGRVIDNLSLNLKFGGLLFLGHSESIMTIPHRARFTQVAPSVYRNLTTEGGPDGTF